MPPILTATFFGAQDSLHFVFDIRMFSEDVEG